MKAFTRTAGLGLVALAALSVGVSGCNKRSATVDTGTAKATVTTTAPANEVTNTTLETQAAIAATAASKPVDGSSPVNSMTPAKSDAAK